MAIGLYLYFSQQVSLSTFLLFLILGVSYLKPILSLSTLANNMYSVMEGIKRVDTILEDKNQILDSKKKVNFKNYNIKFTNVNFAYDKQEVLKNINLDIPQGKITAFIGVSGAGKSTACELLARFYDVSQGKIEIGEHNIKDIDFSQLMNTVSYVFQDNFMFNDSLFNNITMGRNIAKQKVINAAKIANIDSYINSLSEGYDTKYGEDGVVLSGGQKQKIQLARIILKDAPIFILDEATSFFDAKNEYEIQKLINKLIINKTVIVVAHRLATIVNCDNIVLWDNGEIIAMGTHENLLKNCSKYQNMWEKKGKLMGLIYNLKFIIKDNKKEFFNMLIFHFCHSILMSIPTGILVVIIFELFKKNPNQGFIWNLIILLVLLLVLQLWLSAKAYTKASTVTYKIQKT